MKFKDAILPVAEFSYITNYLFSEYNSKMELQPLNIAYSAYFEHAKLTVSLKKERKGKERKGRWYLYSAFKYARILTKRSGMDHTVLPATTPCLPFLRQRSPDGAITTEAADIQLQLTTYLSTPKGWKAELAWLVDLQRMVYPRQWSVHQLQVERKTRKVRRPKTDVIPLCHATNLVQWIFRKQCNETKDPGSQTRYSFDTSMYYTRSCQMNTELCINIKNVTC